MTNTTAADVNAVMKAAAEAAGFCRKASPESKASFLEAIAREMESITDALLDTASEETNLSSDRLKGELGRTTSQLHAFAAMLREGSWVEAAVDTAIPDRKPTPKPDIRKMLVPLGPVVVFGASNFPFAYSTAGGDTASALAAGCPVIVKAHPAHAKTSEMVYEAIQKAMASGNMPAGVCQHVSGEFETGKALVQHPATAAVGFTGSFTGGTALVKYAQERKAPIPVFSEMGSVNPVILLPDTLEKNAASLAVAFAGSVTVSVGQFCTNPGLMFGVESEALENFYSLITKEIRQLKPAKMLNKGIHTGYTERMEKALAQPGVHHPASDAVAGELEALPQIACVNGDAFINNLLLHEEVFGPYSLLIRCKNMDELTKAWQLVSGQLTTSLAGTEKDFTDYEALVDLATAMAGRIVFNGVPTGVEVCASMVHGGPFPATTDSRFTAVGINAVRRWVRPVCYQNCPQHLLPPALQDNNPLNIRRFVNNEWTKAPVE